MDALRLGAGVHVVDVMHRADRFQASADRAAVTRRGGIQMNFQLAGGECLEHRHDQQAGRVLAEAIGNEADPDRRVDGRHRVGEGQLPAQGRHLRIDGGGKVAGAVKLFFSGDVLGQKAERRDAGDALGHRFAQAGAEQPKLAPLAKPAQGEDALAQRGTVGSVELQCTRIGLLGVIRSTQLIQHQPGVVGVLAVRRRQLFGAQEGLRRVGMLAAHAVGMTQHGVRAGHPRGDLQGLAGVNGGLFGMVDFQFGRRQVEAQARMIGRAMGGHRIGRACLQIARGGHQCIAERQQDHRVAGRHPQRGTHAFDRLVRATVGNFHAGQVALHFPAAGTELLGLIKQAQGIFAPIELVQRDGVDPQQFGRVLKTRQCLFGQLRGLGIGGGFDQLGQARQQGVQFGRRFGQVSGIHPTTLAYARSHAKRWLHAPLSDCNWSA